MNDDFQINEDMIEATEPLLDEKVTELVQEIEAKKIRLLAHAFVDGYDGVDIKMEPKTRWKDSMANFKVGFEYEAWEDKPPELGISPSGIHRYDFRQLDEFEKRELVGHIGLTQVPEDVE